MAGEIDYGLYIFVAQYDPANGTSLWDSLLYGLGPTSSVTYKLKINVSETDQ